MASYSGYDPNTSNQTGVAKQVVQDFKEVMKKPETYQRAVMTIGQGIALLALTVPFEGAGSMILADNITMPAVSTSVENSIARYSVEQAAQDHVAIQTMIPWKNPENVNTIAIAGNEEIGYSLGTNGRWPEKVKVPSDLGQPRVSLGPRRKPLNCAEPKAIAEALSKGAAKSEIYVSTSYDMRMPIPNASTQKLSQTTYESGKINYLTGTVETKTWNSGTYFPKAACKNCEVTLKGTAGK